MNQEAVYRILLETEPTPSPFTLVFSGRENRKVNGLYKPDSAEIVIHNRNFDSDNQLIYTALHEYAHHLHHCRNAGLSQARPHTQEFWAIFHDLVSKAEGKGLYKNVFETEPEFQELTRQIKERCMRANGEILLEFGRLLSQAAALCRTYKMRFEDYIERVVGIPRATATAAIAAEQIGLDPGLGWDSLMFVSKIKNPDDRAQVIESLSAGASPTAVKGMLKSEQLPDNSEERLLKEKHRIERSIENLTRKLEDIEEALSAIQA